MYYDHFGLNQPPFRITPDTRLFFAGGRRGEVLDALLYAVASGEGIVKVVGEVGTGKTMLSRMLEMRLGADVDIVYLANPSLSPEDCLHAIALEMDLPIPADANRLEVMHELQRRLLEKHAQNRQVVVFVEEAQSMPIATLEEIRLLSNLETNEDKLLQIVLFGQPELDRNLDNSAIRQLRERITHSFYLSPFNAPEIREYIKHRLQAVGYRGPDLFTDGAYRALASASKGLTRRVNILADKALLSAFAQNTHAITRKHVAIAVRDSEFGRRSGWSARAVGIAALVLLAMGLAVFALLPADGPEPRSVSAAPEGSVPPPERVLAEAGGAGEAADVEAEGADGGMLGTVVADVSAAPPPPRAPEQKEAQSPVEPVVEVSSPVDPAVPEAEQPAPAAPVTVVQEPEPQPAPVVAAVAEVVEPAEVPVQAELVARVEVREPEPIAAPAPKASAPPPPTEAVTPENGSRFALLDQRLEATRMWLETAAPGHYSIQLMAADGSDRAHLEDFLWRWRRAGELDAIYVYKTTIRGRLWYGVLYKEYSSFREAQVDLERLAPDLKRHRPFIRNVRDINTLG